jgi:hypothetical protein
VSISPETESYLDPTGVANPDGTYTVVVAVAPNEMGTREYDLRHAQLTVSLP